MKIGLGLRRAAQHHRQGRGGRAPHGRPARPRRARPAREAQQEARLRLGEARDHAAPAGRGAPPRHPGRRLRAGSEARLPERRRGRARARLRQPSTTSASPAWRSTSTARACRTSRASASRAPSTDLKPVQLSIDLRVQHAMRDELVKGMEHFRAKAAASHAARRQHGRGHLARLAARFRPEQPGRRARQGPHQPDDRRRLRDGLDLQGADHRDGARFRQGDHQLDLRRARRSSITAASPSATTTRRTAS